MSGKSRRHAELRSWLRVSGLTAVARSRGRPCPAGDGGGTEKEPPGHSADWGVILGRAVHKGDRPRSASAERRHADGGGHPWGECRREAHGGGQSFMSGRGVVGRPTIPAWVRTRGSGGSSGSTRRSPRARSGTPTSPRSPASRWTPSTGRPTRRESRVRADRLSRGVPVHPRAARHRVPRPGVDHPAVRRLRQRDADQRALQDDPGRGRGRTLRRLRHADPHGPRLRRPPLARRGRPLRRRDRHRGRHGRALRRHPARSRRRRR